MYVFKYKFSPNKRQAIIWTYDGLIADPYMHYTAGIILEWIILLQFKDLSY